MAEAFEQLKSQARALSAPERADLAHFLLTSLEPAEEGVQEAWRAEIDRRVAEIRNGSAVGRSADEVLGDLRERYP
jgi:putative addiction module component (TIGR02574 family)